ncbi:MAG: acetyl-CoA C-acetyltransferase [candidate division NC10 bacterium]|nr:acetyl-CoA C-acetyltransferase [candidate division NC10 bacterium]
MRDVVIVGAARTAIGTFGGSLKEFSATDLGAIVVREALKRADLTPGSVDEVIMGNVLQAGLGENPARQCAVRAGIPVEVPSYTINKLCGSGLKAVALGALAISVGESDVVVAGGTESMTNAPYLIPKGRWGFRMGDETVVDSMLKDGLLDAFSQVHMGITAENLAERFRIGREDQDAFANESIRRALAAIDQQAFREEIVPIEIPQKRGSPFIFDVDEFPRTRPTPEAMAGLRPAFKKEGTVTSGTASGISDGAAAVVLMAREKAEAEDVAPLASIRAYATAGVDPQIMGTGPIAAVKKVLEKTGLSIDEIDLVEANEAFAVQALCVAKALKFKPERTNINGGAVALGHPIGASGCRLLVTLLYGMKRLDKHVGLATLCIGGGQGIAMVVER